MCLWLLYQIMQCVVNMCRLTNSCEFSFPAITSAKHFMFYLTLCVGLEGFYSYSAVSKTFYSSAWNILWWRNVHVYILWLAAELQFAARELDIYKPEFTTPLMKVKRSWSRVSKARWNHNTAFLCFTDEMRLLCRNAIFCHVYKR